MWYKTPTGTWTHIFMNNGTNYTNGVVSNPSTKPMYISGTNIQIGKTAVSSYFNGSIDEVMIWNRTLSA